MVVSKVITTSNLNEWPYFADQRGLNVKNNWDLIMPDNIPVLAFVSDMGGWLTFAFIKQVGSTDQETA